MADDRIIFCTICKVIHTDGKHLTLEEVEKRYILQVYEATGRNKSLTAKLLRINLRTVQRKLHCYN